MAIQLPLSEMTLAEKLQVLESLWADLSQPSAHLPMPVWHQEVLDARLITQADYRDWEEVKQEIAAIPPAA